MLQVCCILLKYNSANFIFLSGPTAESVRLILSANHCWTCDFRVPLSHRLSHDTTAPIGYCCLVVGLYALSAIQNVLRKSSTKYVT